MVTGVGADVVVVVVVVVAEDDVVAVVKFAGAVVVIVVVVVDVVVVLHMVVDLPRVRLVESFQLVAIVFHYSNKTSQQLMEYVVSEQKFGY